MTSATDRQKRVLVYLLIAFGVVISWRFLPELFQRTNAAARARAEMAEIRAGEIVKLDLAALAAEAESYTAGRNLFLFGRKPLPPPPPPPPPPPRVADNRPPPPPPPPPKPTPPPFKMTLLGIFGPEGRRIAAFKAEDLIVNVVERGKIEDKFIVHQINVETVDIAFVGFPDEKPQRVKIGTNR